MLTKDMLTRLWPHCEAHCPGLIDGIIATEAAVFAKYGLNSALVVAHFMAQVSHEFGAGTEMQENLNYRAEGLIETWPRHFNSANAYLYAHKPEKIANYVYEPPIHNDLGNRPDSSDGWDFRGDGGTQPTGRAAYEALSRILGLDLLSNPRLVESPEHFLEVAAADFVVLCKCLPYAQADDLHGVTQHLNGGQIGASERAAWLVKWKAALGASAPARPADGILRYGDRGWEVKAAQAQLAEKDYNVGEPDGKFGATTRAAVLALQADNNLPTTGEIDRATKDALGTAPPRPVAEERATATVADLRDKGSDTVAAADNIGKIAKGAAGVGGAIGAEKTGILDQAQQASDQFGIVKSIAETAQDAIQWVEGHLWLGLIIGGAVALYFGRDIIKERLAHYQAGASVREK